MRGRRDRLRDGCRKTGLDKWIDGQILDNWLIGRKTKTGQTDEFSIVSQLNISLIYRLIVDLRARQNDEQIHSE